jgi:hypothetical protein
MGYIEETVVQPVVLEDRQEEELQKEVTPYCDLLRHEVRVQIPRRAKMTRLQRLCWEAYVVNGESLARIGQALGISKVAAHYHVQAALKKARTVRNVGLFTVLVEQFGIELVREVLSGD